MNCCGCILSGQKYLNSDKSIDKERFSIILEKWYQEQITYNITDQIAFNVIKEWCKNICQCECHII